MTQDNNEPIRLWELDSNSTFYDRLVAAPSDSTRTLQWSGYIVLTSIISIFTTLLLLSIITNKTTRRDTFNTYLIFLIIPDWIFSVLCVITCSMNVANGAYWSDSMCKFQSIYITFGIAANGWLNAVIAREMHKMLLAVKNFKRHTLPSRPVIMLQSLAIYFYSLCLGLAATSNILPYKERLLYGLACLPADYNTGSTIFFWLVFMPLFALIPVGYVIYMAWDIYSHNLIPETGSKRFISFFFGRLVAVYLLFWIPTVVFVYVLSPFLSQWVGWAFGGWSHFQGLASGIVTLTKPDIGKGFREFLGIPRCGDSDTWGGMSECSNKGDESPSSEKNDDLEEGFSDIMLTIRPSIDEIRILSIVPEEVSEDPRIPEMVNEKSNPVECETILRESEHEIKHTIEMQQDQAFRTHPESSEITKATAGHLTVNDVDEQDQLALQELLQVHEKEDVVAGAGVILDDSLESLHHRGRLNIPKSSITMSLDSKSTTSSTHGRVVSFKDNENADLAPTVPTRFPIPSSEPNDNDQESTSSNPSQSLSSNPKPTLKKCGSILEAGSITDSNLVSIKEEELDQSLTTTPKSILKKTKIPSFSPSKSHSISFQQQEFTISPLSEISTASSCDSESQDLEEIAAFLQIDPTPCGMSRFMDSGLSDEMPSVPTRRSSFSAAASLRKTNCCTELADKMPSAPTRRASSAKKECELVDNASMPGSQTNKD